MAEFCHSGIHKQLQGSGESDFESVSKGSACLLIRRQSLREPGRSEAMETQPRCEAGSAASPRWLPPRPGGDPARQVHPLPDLLPGLGRHWAGLMSP